MAFRQLGGLVGEVGMEEGLCEAVPETEYQLPDNLFLDRVRYQSFIKGNLTDLKKNSNSLDHFWNEIQDPELMDIVKYVS